MKRSTLKHGRKEIQNRSIFPKFFHAAKPSAVGVRPYRVRDSGMKTSVRRNVGSVVWFTFLRGSRTALHAHATSGRCLLYNLPSASVRAKRFGRIHRNGGVNASFYGPRTKPIRVVFGHIAYCRGSRGHRDRPRSRVHCTRCCKRITASRVVRLPRRVPRQTFRYPRTMYFFFSPVTAANNDNNNAPKFLHCVDFRSSRNAFRFITVIIRRNVYLFCSFWKNRFFHRRIFDDYGTYCFVLPNVGCYCQWR